MWLACTSRGRRPCRTAMAAAVPAAWPVAHIGRCTRTPPEGEVAGAHAASGHEEVRDVLRVEAAVGDADPASVVDVHDVDPAHPESLGMMVIDPPVGEGDRVGVHDLFVEVPLGHDVVAHQASAFAHSGDVVQPGHPAGRAEFPRLRVVVLGVVPETEVDAKELVADLLGVPDGVGKPTEFDIPRVGATQL